MPEAQTFSKEERLCSRKAIDRLFGGRNSFSLVAFPLRVVCMPVDEPTSQLLLSVPKRCFKRAVKRNRVKRQLREAYRRHKDLLPPQSLHLAMIWLDDKLYDTAKVEQKVITLMTRIKERISP